MKLKFCSPDRLKLQVIFPALKRSFFCELPVSGRGRVLAMLSPKGMCGIVVDSWILANFVIILFKQVILRIMKNIFIAFFVAILFTSCERDRDIDTEKPEIDLYIEGAFPANCDTLYFGEAFNLRVLFTDNVELGSFSIDIHHNFDHHSHSTEITECNPDPVKVPVNPFVFIQDYNIPGGSREYETDLPIIIPASNNSGSFDEGDYHFAIRLTDKEGWSTYKGLSIKMAYR